MQKQLQFIFSRYLLVVLLLVSYTAPILALVNNGSDKQIVEIADEALKLELKPIAQDYPNKEITMSLIINPAISSGKVTVNWIYDENLFTAVGGDQDIIDLTADQPYLLKKIFKPVGKYEPLKVNPTSVGVRVAAAAFNKNYISVRKSDFTINSSYEAVPEFANYTQIKGLYAALYIVLSVIGIALIVVLISYGVIRFRKYLNSD